MLKGEVPAKPAPEGDIRPQQDYISAGEPRVNPAQETASHQNLPKSGHEDDKIFARRLTNLQKEFTEKLKGLKTDLTQGGNAESKVEKPSGIEPKLNDELARSVREIETTLKERIAELENLRSFQEASFKRIMGELALREKTLDEEEETRRRDMSRRRLELESEMGRKLAEAEEMYQQARRELEREYERKIASFAGHHSMEQKSRKESWLAEKICLEQEIAGLKKYLEDTKRQISVLSNANKPEPADSKNKDASHKRAPSVDKVVKLKKQLTSEQMLHSGELAGIREDFEKKMSEFETEKQKSRELFERNMSEFEAEKQKIAARYEEMLRLGKTQRETELKISRQEFDQERRLLWGEIEALEAKDKMEDK